MTNRRISTALKILALMRERAPVALSSHGLGLHIQDETHQLSGIVKALRKEGYVRKAGPRGKRTAYWELTEAGLVSLRNRAALAAEAARWLEANPSYQVAEQAILTALEPGQEATPADLADATGLRVVPIRHALRRLQERGLIQFDPARDTARLNTNGEREHARLLATS